MSTRSTVLTLPPSLLCLVSFAHASLSTAHLQSFQYKLVLLGDSAVGKYVMTKAQCSVAERGAMRPDECIACCCDDGG